MRDFHRRLPGYAPTAVHDLPEMASTCGVGRVLVKAEVERMGLPSFKVLGASWATYRLLCQELLAVGALGPGGGAVAGAGGADRAGGGASAPGRSVEQVVVEPEWSSMDELADVVGRHLGPLRLVSATDGNHGRAVAYMARLCGLAATILVPRGTAEARIDAIAAEGAEVLVVEGTYDDAVTASAAFTGGDDSVRRNAVAVVDDGRDAEVTAERRLALSDTAWPGNEDVPRWVIQGYSTIFAELDEQLPALGIDPPDVVIVPLGVGALGAAAAMAVKGIGAPEGDAASGRGAGPLEPARTARAGPSSAASAQAASRRAPDPAGGNGPPLLVGVEPDSAACVAAAVEAGHVVEVPGPHRSIMAGLNCGLASPVALPYVATGFDALVAVDDDRCRHAIKALAASAIDVGETGAAALAGLTALVDDHRAEIPLAPDATVLLLATEGVTDPTNFRAIVGRPPLG